MSDGSMGLGTPIRLRTQDPQDPRHVSVALNLYRYADGGTGGSKAAAKPVLLLHGASANHETFTAPRIGTGGKKLPSLVEWLVQREFDPWLLDWRGTGLAELVAENAGSLEHNGAVYNFNTAARYDLPMAVTTICEYLNRTDPIAILGHCMGSAILAEAVALGHVRPNEVDCIVLSALGLFYETPIDGRLKSEERILEQLQVESEGQGRPCVSINPTVVGAPGPSWPEKLDDLYQKWPARLKSHIKTLSGAETPAIVECDLAREMCNRVGFMYGAPYHHDNLIDEIHGTDHISPELRNQFGAIPLHMYIHGARNTRRGRATYYVLPTDDPELASKRAAELLSDDEVRERFKAMKKVTLMTGALNRLWHRDSIDLMYEWLRRGVSKHPCQFTKRVFPEYGHQDLFWGKNSADDVFPTIKDGLD